MNSLSAVRVEKIAAGLWHTLCVSDEGLVYAFGGNQFGQLGTGADQAEVLVETCSISLFFFPFSFIKFAGQHSNPYIYTIGNLSESHRTILKNQGANF